MCIRFVAQNRMSRQADRRAHLDLQVSMLGEQEMTLMLQMQHRLAEHLGMAPLDSEPDANQLMKKTDVEQIVEEIEEHLPDAKL